MTTVQHIDWLVQERRNSIVNALELCLSRTNPPIYVWREYICTDDSSLLHVTFICINIVHYYTFPYYNTYENFFSSKILIFFPSIECIVIILSINSRNLLRPAGVQLRPATFKLKLYRAEDIPRSRLSLTEILSCWLIYYHWGVESCHSIYSSWC